MLRHRPESSGNTGHVDWPACVTGMSVSESPTHSYLRRKSHMKKMREVTIRVEVPENEDQKLLWAASIAQTAALFYVNSTDLTEDDAIAKAFQMYGDVLEHLENAELLGG